MRHIVGLCVAVAFGMGVLVAPPLKAAENEDNPVVAKVNDAEIRASDLKIAAEDLVAQLTGVPAKQRYQFLVEYLIERYLLVQAAEKAGTAETDEFKNRMRYYAGKALRDTYFSTEIETQITEEDAKKVYQREIEQISPEDEVRVRQIFVKTEETAKEVHAKLSKGADFAEMAREYSISPTASVGGELKYFTRDKVEPEFGEVAFSLKKDEISQPFKVQYGWQILKLEDRRQRVLQTFDRVKNGIRGLLLRSKVSELVADMREKATIEYMDPDAEPQGPKTAASGKSGKKSADE